MWMDDTYILKETAPPRRRLRRRRVLLRYSYDVILRLFPKLFLRSADVVHSWYSYTRSMNVEGRREEGHCSFLSTRKVSQKAAPVRRCYCCCRRRRSGFLDGAGERLFRRIPGEGGAPSEESRAPLKATPPPPPLPPTPTLVLSIEEELSLPPSLPPLRCLLSAAGLFFSPCYGLLLPSLRCGL